MANKKTAVTFAGMQKDTSKSKYNKNYYYDANNITLTPIEGQSFGSLTNTPGNTLAITIPTPTINKILKTVTAGTHVQNYARVEIDSMPASGSQIIIGDTLTKDGILLFTTDNAGFDCIWEIPNINNSPLALNLLYIGNLEFSTSNPIQPIFNYENEIIQKVYWVDGKNYFRFINIKEYISNGYERNIIDIPAESINSRGEFDAARPTVIGFGTGGAHTSGVIQYAFTLYNLNGSETQLSPLSDIYPLDKGLGLGGGEVNEVVGAMPIVEITNIDSRYSYLKLFSIKYTDYNTLPSITLIYDGAIGNNTRFVYNDSGLKNLGNLGIAELLFLGADPIIPKHIATKDNIMFAANNEVSVYKLDIDTRAYSFNFDGTSAPIYSNIVYTGTGDIPYTGDVWNAATDINVPLTHDAVNLDFDTYRHLSRATVTSTTTVGVGQLYEQDGVYYETLGGSSITIDFNSVPDIGTTISINESLNNINLNEVFKDVRLAVYQSELPNFEPADGIHPDRYFGNTATFYKNALDSDYNSTALFTITTVLGPVNSGLGTVTIAANYLNANFSVVTNTTGVPITVNNSLNTPYTGNVYFLNGVPYKTLQTTTTTTPTGYVGEGGTGKYISYQLLKSNTIDVPSSKIGRFFKDNEIYRIAIVFRNALGQETEAKWIADFKAPEGNLKGTYNTLKIVFSEAFKTYILSLPEVDRPVSYSIVRAIRKSTDRTIIAQGMLTGMFVQALTTNFDLYDTNTEKANANPSLLKVPVPFTRGYGTGSNGSNSYFPIFPTTHNKGMGIKWDAGTQNFAGTGVRKNSTRSHASEPEMEIYCGSASGYASQLAWQFTKLMQLHSPEVAFNIDIEPSDADLLTVLGILPRNSFEYKARAMNITTFQQADLKTFSASLGQPGYFYPLSPIMYTVVGPVDRDNDNTRRERAVQLHSHKTFLNLILNGNKATYPIYGTPEITEVGQAPKLYNGDINFKYANTLVSTITDGNNLSDTSGDILPITGVDSDGSRCITLALGNVGDLPENRPSLENIFTAIGGGSWDSELFAEIRKPNSYIYSGALYGGYDRSSKVLTEYVNIGNVGKIDLFGTNELFINSPGDTFVQIFKNTRLTRRPGTYTHQRSIVLETLDYLVETTVNLEERNDISVKPWASILDAYHEEAFKYNKVYSTDPIIRTYTGDNLKIRQINQAETQIIASKTKIPGEFVESWGDFKPNEVQNLDGKYGPITALISHSDTVYAFQDSSVARIGINPRVQVQGNDGVEIELGSGQILHDYDYLTTKIGTTNKWGIVSSNTGLYFVDTAIKQVFALKGAGIEPLSEVKGMHTFFYNNIVKKELSNDTPVTGKGISGGVDWVNGDVFMTFKDSVNNKNLTISYNEKLNAYVSLYDFKPSRYISKGDKLYTTSPDNRSLWVHGQGAYQTFYGTKYESYVTLLLNTDEVHAEKVFNSIEFDSEVTLNGIDVVNSTITSLEAWTDYQTSGRIQLIVNDNIKRRFRTWRANIPREQNKRVRLRDKWLFLKLGFNPVNNNKLVLHDIIMSYSS